MLGNNPHDLEGPIGPSSADAATRIFSERGWTIVLVGLVLLVAGASYVFRGTSLPGSTQTVPPRLPASMVILSTGEEPIWKIFNQAGCVVCHTIPGIADARGRVGPTLVLGTTGKRRLEDPGYHGQATTVREYVIESILSPGAYVVPGYPDRVMPVWYGQKLSAGALEKVVDYLEQRTEDGATSRLK